MLSPSPRIPLETQTLYAELLEHLLAIAAERSLGHLPGTFVTKQVKGETYSYFQASLPGGSTKQIYVGRWSPATKKMVSRFFRERAARAPDVERSVRLAAQLRAGGVNTTDAPSARVIRGLADAGVFEAGGIMVGTHAFVALGNLLGRKWTSGSLRTQDIDIATSVDRDIDIAVSDLQADLPSTLESLAMGFLPVPALHPKHPSTSFKVRGQSLRVDLLCPGTGDAGESAPVEIRRFRAAAQPLRFLGYLLEAPERAVALNGGAALVNVPGPARFALHKLMVATIRPAAFQTKADKDVAQAVAILAVLLEDRPGDISLAWESLVQRGRTWVAVARRGLAALRRREAALADALVPLLSTADVK